MLRVLFVIAERLNNELFMVKPTVVESQQIPSMPQSQVPQNQKPDLDNEGLDEDH